MFIAEQQFSRYFVTFFDDMVLEKKIKKLFEITGFSGIFSIEQIIHPRRYEDKKDDIWTTYQRVQENLIKGGLPGRTEKGKRTTTRPVKAIDGDVKLNKALWLIAEKFRTLKG